VAQLTNARTVWVPLYAVKDGDTPVLRAVSLGDRTAIRRGGGLVVWMTGQPGLEMYEEWVEVVW
jgi:hypothetical protein